MKFNRNFAALSVAATIALSPLVSATAEPKITMEGWIFAPDDVTVGVGESITFFNNDDTTHDVAFLDEMDNFPNLEKPHKIRMNKEYKVSFEKAGTYEYVCRRHKRYDMKGVIKVVEAGK